MFTSIPACGVHIFTSMFTLLLFISLYFYLPILHYISFPLGLPILAKVNVNAIFI